MWETSRPTPLFPMNFPGTQFRMGHTRGMFTIYKYSFYPMSPRHPSSICIEDEHPIKISVMKDNYGGIQIKELVTGIHQIKELAIHPPNQGADNRHPLNHGVGHRHPPNQGVYPGHYKPVQSDTRPEWPIPSMGGYGLFGSHCDFVFWVETIL